MRSRSLAGAALTVLIAFAPCAVAAQNEFGKQEYDSKCASCHGVGARGNGWMAKYLSRSTPSLTQLTRKHGGKYPSDYVYQVIDGRKEVELHGPRDMPIWGVVIPAELEKKKLGARGPSKAAIQGRIRALVEYIAELQE